MILPAPLDTGPLPNGVLAVRDGLVNLYVARAPGGLVCLDAGWRPSRVARGFARLGLDPGTVAAILFTHSHWDHAWAAKAFPHAALHGAAPGKGWLPCADGQTLSVAGLEVQVLGCPGHTADSLAFLAAGGLLFTGDTVRLRHGLAEPSPRWLNQDQALLRQSLRRLARLEGVQAIHTSHWGASLEPAKAFGPWRP